MSAALAAFNTWLTKDRANHPERAMRAAREAFLAGYEEGAKVDPFVSGASELGFGRVDCTKCLYAGAACGRPEVRDGDAGGCTDGATVSFPVTLQGSIKTLPYMLSTGVWVSEAPGLEVVACNNCALYNSGCTHHTRVTGPGGCTSGVAIKE